MRACVFSTLSWVVYLLTWARVCVSLTLRGLFLALTWARACVSLILTTHTHTTHHTRTYTHTHTQTHARMHACTRTLIHTRTHICPSLRLDDHPFRCFYRQFTYLISVVYCGLVSYRVVSCSVAWRRVAGRHSVKTSDNIVA